MGANSTQAQGIVLLLAAFVLLSVGLAASGSVLAFATAAVVLAGAIWRFRVAKSMVGSEEK